MAAIRVRVLRACAFDGSVWQPGDVAEVSRELADALIAAGDAEAVVLPGEPADDADDEDEGDEA